MSGVHGQMLGHLVRRGVDVAQVHFQEAPQGTGNNEGAPVVEINPREYLPVILIGLVTAVLIGSVRPASEHNKARTVLTAL